MKDYFDPFFKGISSNITVLDMSLKTVYQNYPLKKGHVLDNPKVISLIASGKKSTSPSISHVFIGEDNFKVEVSRLVTERGHYILLNLSPVAASAFSVLTQKVSELESEIKNRIKLEMTLKSLNEQLEQKVFERTADLENLQNTLRKKERLASLGTLISGISHEIRNPLNILKMSLAVFDNFSEEYSPEKINSASSFSDLGEYFKEDLISLIQSTPNFKENVNRINEIIFNMVGIAGGDSNPNQKTPSDVNQLLLTAKKLIEKSNKESGVKIETKLAQDLPKVNIIYSDMLRVFINFIENAMYAIKESSNNSKGTIVLESYLEGDSVLLIVSDNGSGISPENLSRLFEPFFTTKPSDKGTGLGLHLCHKIIESNDGEISVDSKLNEGTVFTVTLPVQ